MNVAVCYEGVLTKGDNHPILEGIDVARSLASMGRLSVLSEAPQQAVERFLGVHRVDPIAQVLSGSERPGEAPLFIRQVDQIRSGGERLDTVIVPDPAWVPVLLRARLAVMVFLSPGSTPPVFRPDDSGRKLWEEIEKDIAERTY